MGTGRDEDRRGRSLGLERPYGPFHRAKNFCFNYTATPEVRIVGLWALHEDLRS